MKDKVFCHCVNCRGLFKIEEVKEVWDNVNSRYFYCVECWKIYLGEIKEGKEEEAKTK